MHTLGGACLGGAYPRWGVYHGGMLTLGGASLGGGVAYPGGAYPCNTNLCILLMFLLPIDIPSCVKAVVL